MHNGFDYYYCWLKIVSYIDCLKDEGIIEEITHKSLHDDMMRLKDLIYYRRIDIKTKIGANLEGRYDGNDITISEKTAVPIHILVDEEFLELYLEKIKNIITVEED